MDLHQKNENMLSDEHFELETLSHLVAGNRGRLLDGRRTPGILESYDAESAMFIWRITDFEDKGEFWEIPAEEINGFQFEKNSNRLKETEVKIIEDKCKKYSERLVIEASQQDYLETQEELADFRAEIHDWFLSESTFVKEGGSKLDLRAKEGCQYLFQDLHSVMKRYNLLELEIMTTKQYILEPYSERWIKGMRIVMAEMGLIDFNEKIPRIKEIFEGIGTKENRRKYIKEIYIS
ncbi:MAG: hypothetical protein GX962_12340 [Epulopiscium sp.]|nr:hypothetical protein [Candidatus Epulonipiscium sp.]